MNDTDKKWMKPLIISLVIGYAAGKILYELTGLLGLDSGIIGSFRNFFIPIGLVVALLIVLYLHNKEES